MSRPSFHVATQFLLPATLIPCHSFPFMLRDHLFVFCLYSGCDSKLLICLVPCHDMQFRLRLGRFFPCCTFCSNQKGRLRLDYTFLIPTLSQPHFLITTVLTQFSFYFWSRPRKYVVTEWLPFSPLLLSQLLKLSCNMLLTVQPIFMSRHEISVVTSTGVFSFYFVATTNSLVETFLVH